MSVLWSAFQTVGGLLLVAIVLGGVFFVVKSLPDIARYRRIKQM